MDFGGDFSYLSYSSQGLLFSRGYPDRFGHHQLPNQLTGILSPWKVDVYIPYWKKKRISRQSCQMTYKLSIMFKGSSFFISFLHSPSCGPDLFGQCSQLCGVERPILWWSSAQNWSALYQVLCQALGPQHRWPNLIESMVCFFEVVCFQSLQTNQKVNVLYQGETSTFGVIIIHLPGWWFQEFVSKNAAKSIGIIILSPARLRSFSLLDSGAIHECRDKNLIWTFTLLFIRPYSSPPLR